MNVVVATDFAHVNGGAGRIALESAKGLARRGHAVTLFTGVGPIADDLQSVPGLTHACLGQHDVWHDPHRVRAAVHGLWNRAAARRMDGVLATLDPHDTIVHLHSWSKSLSSSVVRRVASRGFRIVTTLHDFLSVCPTGTLFNHRTETPCELEPLSLACATTNCDAKHYANKVWRVARHTIQGSLGSLPGHGRDFITVSDASARILSDLLPRGSRLHRVQNFTEVPREDRAAVGQNADIVYVGRLSAEKGPLLLADCLNRLKLPAVFVGDGELSAAVRARYPAAEVTGWLTPERVRDRVRRARALVLPSLWYETQGLVVAEAAAMGVPAIVPDRSAARDWVVHGVTGLWFQGGSADDLSAAVARLAGDAALAARLGHAAYTRFWSAPPTLDRHLEALERVYRIVLASGARAQAARERPHLATEEPC